jgi:SAM-dependent methyltransferase
MNVSSKSAVCRLCQAPTVSFFMGIREVPIYCNVLWSSRSQAVNAPKGNLQLGFCRSCGHIFNYAFDPTPMDYTVEYENSLHFSPHFQTYAEALARHLVDRYDIRKKQVIDVGCGKGDFLAAVCEIGDNHGIGFDRSYSPDDATHNKALKLRFIQDFYTEQHSNYHADLLCCRHVLEHIEYPREFLRQIRNVLANKTETVVFFEVPNAMYTLRDLGIWDLIYEHCSYFSASSLLYLFGASGFNVKNICELYDGQFIGIECVPVEPGIHSTVVSDVTELHGSVMSFAERYRLKVERWKAKFDDLARAGERAVVWGGGSKGVTFLNIFDAKQVAYMVDINPRKHGKYVAGTGHQIVPPEFLAEYKPDAVIVMNAVYEAEISTRLDQLGVSAELMFG